MVLTKVVQAAGACSAWDLNPRCLVAMWIIYLEGMSYLNLSGGAVLKASMSGIKPVVSSIDHNPISQMSPHECRLRLVGIAISAIPFWPCECSVTGGRIEAAPALDFAAKWLGHRHGQGAPEQAAALQECLHLQVAVGGSHLNGDHTCQQRTPLNNNVH